MEKEREEEFNIEIITILRRKKVKEERSGESENNFGYSFVKTTF